MANNKPVWDPGTIDQIDARFGTARLISVSPKHFAVQVWGAVSGRWEEVGAYLSKAKARLRFKQVIDRFGGKL